MTTETAQEIIETNERRKELEKLKEYLRDFADGDTTRLHGDISGKPFYLEFSFERIREVLELNLRGTILHAVLLNNQASIEIKR